MNILNWVGLISLIIGFICFSLIGLKRSAWWGPAKSVIDDFDSVEKRFAKIGLVFVLIGFMLFIIANL